MTMPQRHHTSCSANDDNTSFDEVFHAELQEIRKRRKQLGRDTSPLDVKRSKRSLKLASNLGLVGLALSGGGIRSATFSFGVIQALAKYQVLKCVDYLSTVSGGGYIGSCLSSVLNEPGLNDPNTGPPPDTFPFSHQPGVEESDDLDQEQITDDLRFAFKNLGKISEDATVDTLKPGQRWKIKWANFTLTEQALENLREEGLLNESLEKLEDLKEQNFSIEDKFLKAVRQKIGTAQTGRYKEQILKHAQKAAVVPNDEQKLSALNQVGTAAPYHLINVALNLPNSDDPNIRGRNADFFLFSKRFTGSEHAGVGFCETTTVEAMDPHLNLGTAMAISGAAAAPNMGVTTIKPLVFIMTLLNVRLGYWVVKPSQARGASWYRKFVLRRGPGPGYLWKEARGQINERRRYVNVSDGGHLENLGVYPLLRRRCQFIIAVDGEADPELRFGSLVKLIRSARIDMGIQITIDLQEFHRNASGFSGTHWALGTISYGEDGEGYLLYIKASMSGDENLYVNDYQSLNPTFPHQSTADQFFDESQFEAYRALGYHIVNTLFREEQDMGAFEHFRSGTSPA